MKKRITRQDRAFKAIKNTGYGYGQLEELYLKAFKAGMAKARRNFRNRAEALESQLNINMVDSY